MYLTRKFIDGIKTFSHVHLPTSHTFSNESPAVDLFCVIIFRGINQPASRQKRFFGTKITPPIESSHFFNRSKEIRAFNKVFNGPPQLSIISGPVDSGKTSLILNILNEFSNLNHPVLHFDLRERSFVTVNEFESSMKRGMQSWLDQIKEVTKLHKVQTSYGVNIEFTDTSSKQSPIEKLNALFEAISKQMPAHNWWSGKSTPILFIDEANRLRQLLKDKEGHHALTNMFEWFVKNTKQDSRFHVVLASSDSFFHLWVEKYIGASRFKSYVVGNLTQEEAKRFWEEKVVVQVHLLEKLPPPQFEDAYLACGGNMFLLKNYFSEYCQSEGKFSPAEFSLVGAERAKLISALYNDADSSHPHPDRNPASWNRGQFVKMMTHLTTAPGKYLTYKSLCDEIGERTVDAFIDHNLLHLRPTNKFAYDIPGAPLDQPILTAETPSALLAMQAILKEDMNKEKP